MKGRGRQVRAMLSIRVPHDIREAVRDAARRNGITLDDYAATMLAGRSFDTVPARLAKPLADVNYHLTRIGTALDAADVGAAREELRRAQRVVAEHVRPLRREHDRDVASVEPTKTGDWERG